MDAVVLHQLRIFRDAFDEKGKQRQFELLRQAEIVFLERLGVTRPVVRRNPDSREQCAPAVRLDQADHRGEIVANGLDRNAAQAVVAAEFEDHEFRPIFRKHRRQAFEAAGRGFTADAAVDDAERGIFPFDSLGQQLHPALFLAYAIGGAETVAPDKQIALLGRGRHGR